MLLEEDSRYENPNIQSDFRKGIIQLFTGIIQENAKISQIDHHSGKRVISIQSHLMQEDLKIGDSVACNGICLTVVFFNPQLIKVEATLETMNKSTLKYWQVNQSIHLERAMRLSDRLDGHIVQGHVDTITSLARKKVVSQNMYLEFLIDSHYKPLIVPQGSIAIDGVSLTLSKISDHTFEVAIINHTQDNTHFKVLKAGEFVNLEFDIVGKYVINLAQKKGLSIDWLKENGF